MIKNNEADKERTSTGVVLERIVMPDNLIKLELGYYIVRTQAGFKKAIKDFNEDAFKNEYTEFLSHPKSYPSVVQFGFHPNMGIMIRYCVHINRAREVFSAILDACNKA